MPNDADDNTRAPTSQMKLTRPLPAAGPSLESVSEQNAERDRGAQLFSKKKNPDGSRLELVNRGTAG